MPLKVVKGIRGRLYHLIKRFGAANNKHMKDHDKNKELQYLKIQDVNRLYGWQMSQKFPVNSFKWVEDISEFDKSLNNI